MSNTKKFCHILRKRSAEHTNAMERISDLPGIMASILRQELDSMVRVIYLLSIQDVGTREKLIAQTLDGKKWEIVRNGKKYNVTDREMVDTSSQIHGWALSIYKFGCAFIHLSNFHDYSEQNPFDGLSEIDRRDVLMHLRNYHSGPAADNPSFAELADYFPDVFTKIKDNLECYLHDLESNTTGECW